MTDMKYTTLRHDALRSIADGHIELTCTNIKQALWKPRDKRLYGQRLNLSSSDARAINDFSPTGGTWAHTPYWRGDMDVLRQVELTEAGRSLLTRWNVEYGQVAA